ncbi:MAG: VWA domain-containing protein [Thiotrichales bacterium]|nr:VWA domain-containing protein [Thiotrichales bacterium]
MKRPRSFGEVFGLAFLDVITCGFGAMVLLLLITKPAPIDSADEAWVSVDSAVLEGAANLVSRLRSRLEALQARLTEEPERPAAAGGEDPALEEAIRVAGDRLQQLQRDNRGLERVEESLRRATLRTPAPATERDPEVGGIPVDSEYVIFILDTSGSMKSVWGEVMDVMGRVLDIHPKVSGFQVLNDNGAYLISGYRQRWIRDTPRLRASIRNALRNWGAMSNSSPVEGLQTALRTYARREGKIAIYIFGDDFRGESYDRVMETLRDLNVDTATGRSRVRVHAVGFVSTQLHGRYATLMREVTRNHDGAFLALPVQGAGG